MSTEPKRSCPLTIQWPYHLPCPRQGCTCDQSRVLPDDDVERLWAEHDVLAARRSEITARLAEIDGAILASGEAKVRRNLVQPGTYGHGRTLR